MSEAAKLPGQLRQMIAVLECERQALAALDLDSLVIAQQDKLMLCEALDHHVADELSSECRALLCAARQLNEVNRRIRNLLAANVAARLDALGGKPTLYRPACAIRG